MCIVAGHSWRGKKTRDLRSWSSLLFIPLPINDLKLGAFNFESQYLVEVGLRAHNTIWNFTVPHVHKHLMHEVQD
jgi:hypothetical protein